MRVNALKIIPAALILTLVIPGGFLAASAGQKAETRQAKDFKGHHRSQDRLAAILGPQAAAQIQTTRQNTFKETAELRRKIKLGRAELRVLMLQETTTQKELLAKFDRVTAQTDQLKEIFLLHRFELLRQFPDLSLIDRGGAFRQKSGRKAGHRKAAKAHKRRHSSGWAREMEGPALEKMKAERLEFFKANLDLRKQIQLARAQLKVLILDSSVAKEAVVVKYRQLAGLTARLHRAKLIHRWQMKQRFPLTAQTLPRLLDNEPQLIGEG